MATFVPGNGDIMRPYGRCEIRHYPEAASQTFKAGYPVILDAASNENRIKVSADAPTAALVGVACQDATGTTGSMIAVWVAKPELKFQMRTVASDAVDFSDIGTARSIKKHASLNIWVCDTATAGSDSVVVEKYHNPDTNALLTAEGDLEAMVVVHFDPKATVFGAGV
jgi:hypothetical protein